MDTYLISLTMIGFAALALNWVKAVSKKIWVSYSIFYLTAGALIYLFLDVLSLPDPLWKEDFTVHATELIIIISLMNIGLKIDHPFSFREWQVPFRLISITMLLSIGLMALIGYWFLGMDAASAVLLGAVLAPTDPVLASDVQVGPPNSRSEDDNVRFSLTAEAGLNDGMAFPFTWLAVVLAISAQTGEPWLTEWLTRDLLYRLVVGSAVGYGVGKLLAFLLFKMPEEWDLLIAQGGFVALATTFFVYGVSELVHGYGFIAVFVAAVAIRNFEMHHEYHEELHDFSDQVEQIMMAVLLLLFGGSLTYGILHALTWQMAVIGVVFVLLLRPFTAFIALVGTQLKLKEKAAISFFGIKGIGSFFYLSFGVNEAEFIYEDEVWSTVAFIVLISVFIHGLTASAAMKKLNLRYTNKEKTNEH